jgi:hypothetical protein
MRATKATIEQLRYLVEVQKLVRDRADTHLSVAIGEHEALREKAEAGRVELAHARSSARAAFMSDRGLQPALYLSHVNDVGQKVAAVDSTVGRLNEQTGVVHRARDGALHERATLEMMEKMLDDQGKERRKKGQAAAQDRLDDMLSGRGQHEDS